MKPRVSRHPVVFSVSPCLKDPLPAILRLLGVFFILLSGSLDLHAAAPEIQIEESSLNIPNGGGLSLGDVALGANSATQDFIISNTGDADLTQLAVTRSGDHPGDFLITAPAGSVAGGGSTTFSVTFAPDAMGARSCVLLISSNDADENPYEITLSGTGTSTVPLMIGQSAYLKSSAPVSQDYFGYSVAVSGDTVVVGVPLATAINSGAAHVFIRNQGSWVQQAVLVAANPGPEDSFGYSVAISGDTVVVGSLSEDSSTAGVNGIPNEGATDSGAAYVFGRTAGTWTQHAFLKAGNPGTGDRFGVSVAVAADTVVVGAGGEDSGTAGVNQTPDELAADSGAAYVFVRSGLVWSQQAYLKAGNPGVGDKFGSAVAIAEDTLVIGAAREDGGGMGLNSIPDEEAADSGAAYIFRRTGSAWTQQAFLKAGNPGAGDRFGSSVAVSLDTVAVGAPGEAGASAGVNGTPDDEMALAGAAYVFKRSGSVWSQEAYVKAANPGVNDSFGGSVSISEDWLVIGASGESGSSTAVNGPDDDGAFAAGAAYLFERGGAGWEQSAYLKAGNAGVGDYLGLSVAVSGNTVVTGAPSENSSMAGVNGVPNENAVWSGAAYIFQEMGLPDIAVRNPEGYAMLNGISNYDLGYGTVGSQALVYPKAFTLRNYGTSVLSLTDLVVTGADSSDFVVGFSGAMDVAPGDSREMLIWFQPTVSGNRAATLAITSSDADESPFMISLTGIGGTSAQAWRHHYFSTIENTGDAADAADPDGDGQINLLERAFNLHPKQSFIPVLMSGTGTTGLPLIFASEGPGGRMFSIQYLRRKATANPGLTYTPQFNTDLTTPWQDFGGVEVVDFVDTEWERVSVQENADGVPIRFGRVKVVAP